MVADEISKFYLVNCELLLLLLFLLWFERAIRLFSSCLRIQSVILLIFIDSFILWCMFVFNKNELVPLWPLFLCGPFYCWQSFEIAVNGLAWNHFSYFRFNAFSMHEWVCALSLSFFVLFLLSSVDFSLIWFDRPNKMRLLYSQNNPHQVH